MRPEDGGHYVLSTSYHCIETWLILPPQAYLLTHTWKIFINTSMPSHFPDLYEGFRAYEPSGGRTGKRKNLNVTFRESRLWLYSYPTRETKAARDRLQDTVKEKSTRAGERVFGARG